ncbi:protein-tyrosine phosphatase family protein [Actinomadura sp. WAC 06369]|uniref:protein-tyrosine phosphatase family protein n=1 Tax=Actinomadura sp. WAC 06369 TaxID=2203193 RepID=UPI000F769568|nr:protein-tyrosine phosphatase family protein [Actinomadura sp. WAC 06369]RSN60013.1 protein tyrosine phosphatase [Actinomadura sp. WAC 06369]
MNETTNEQDGKGTGTGGRLAGAIRLPDGAWVRGRGLRNGPASGPEPGFGLYLGTAKLRERHEDELRWPHAWIEWPDFRLPRDRDTAVREIRGLHERAKAGEAVEVACGGGIGRTGTVIACLAVLAGVAPGNAVGWAREHHHKRAVETPWQRRWVRNFPPG